KLSLPDRFLSDTADDAPETRSERMFVELDPAERRGLKSAISAVRARRRARKAAVLERRELAA
ncbi:MAG: fatty acid desaturase, partial [Mycobacterium kyogaense]